MRALRLFCPFPECRGGVSSMATGTVERFAEGLGTKDVATAPA
jgi:hypothetical protein